jgi:hypothetical protein
MPFDDPADLKLLGPANTLEFPWRYENLPSLDNARHMKAAESAFSEEETEEEALKGEIPAPRRWFGGEM